MKGITVFVLLLLIFPGIGTAGNLPRDCMQLYRVAASAASNHSQGIAEDQLRSSLPPRDTADANPESNETFILREMHVILDELYAGNPIDSQVYATYKAETCVRIKREEQIPSSFEQARDLLVSCESAEKPIECAMKVAGSAEE